MCMSAEPSVYLPGSIHRNCLRQSNERTNDNANSRPTDRLNVWPWRHDSRNFVTVESCSNTADELSLTLLLLGFCGDWVRAGSDVKARALIVDNYFSKEYWFNEKHSIPIEWQPAINWADFSTNLVQLYCENLTNFLLKRQHRTVQKLFCEKR